MRRTIPTLLIAILLAGSSALHAQTIELGYHKRTDLNPAERAFAEAYLKAVTGSDIEQYKVLLHPATRACINKPENAEYFAPMLSRRVRQRTANPKLSIEELAPGFPLFDAVAKQGYVFPARPTHAFNIDLETKGTRSSSIIAFSILEGGHWYEVLPCPTAKALANMRENKKKEEVENAKARVLVTSLQNPLRAQMMDLIKQGFTIMAARKYSDAMHADLTMSYRVAKILEAGK
jgi:hypothetical protein